MRVGFDAKRAFQNFTGLGNYSRDVMRVLAAHVPAHAYVAYGARHGRLALAPGVEARGPDGWLSRLLPAAWRTRWITSQLARDGLDLFHGLSNELPVGLERTRVRSVVTVHDLIFERFPELYRAADVRIHRWKARRAVRHATLVVAISEQTKQDLVELYGADPARIRVVHQGCHPAFQVGVAPERLRETASKRALPERFVLSVGTVEPRKNLVSAVRALARVPEVPLYVVGRRTAYAGEVQAEAARLGVQGRVRFLDGVDTAELAALYRLCRAVVYPSRYEGFGIPIVEALFSGAPVVTTAGGVFPEAGGPGSLYVDPDDTGAFAAALGRALDDEALRETMARTGREHARRFEDAAVARALSAVYEEAMR
jgi:glycosyltransferase involved in cell wall biosynthesis